MTAGPVSARWSVRLSGDLEEPRGLAKMFPCGTGQPVQVWHEDGGYFLAAPEFETMSEAVEVHARGELWA